VFVCEAGNHSVYLFRLEPIHQARLLSNWLQRMDRMNVMFRGTAPCALLRRVESR
jgi:hypothetical protein